jgi:threonine/homoserine/homoserine lactone efflux protein
MPITFLLKGLLIGFSIAAPVGPIGVLCIQRTLDRGRIYGFVTGLGAATADGFYGFIAGFGLTIISSFLVAQQQWIRLIGGIFLVYLGLRTLLSRPATKAATIKERNLLSAYASTVFLTLTNPTTILSFAAVFAGIGLGGATRDYLSAAILVCGVFLGSALWWFILSGGVNLFRKKFNTQGLRWVNRISGLIILGFGLLALGSLLITFISK